MKLTHYRGKKIGDMTRDELIGALDWFSTRHWQLINRHIEHLDKLRETREPPDPSPSSAA